MLHGWEPKNLRDRRDAYAPEGLTGQSCDLVPKDMPYCKLSTGEPVTIRVSNHGSNGSLMVVRWSFKWKGQPSKYVMNAKSALWEVNAREISNIKRVRR